MITVCRKARPPALALIEQATTGMERLIDSLLRDTRRPGQGQLNRQRVPVEKTTDRIRRTSLENSSIARTGTE